MSTCKDLVFKTDTKQCMYYLNGGMCSKDGRFRCEEYIKQKEPVLSYSGVNSFMKCPRKYYWSSMRGLKVKEHLMGDPLKIGLTVDGYITGGMSPSNLSDSVAMAKINAMCDACAILIDPLNNIWPHYSGQRELLWQEDDYPSVLCKIDLEKKDGTGFVELKCSSRPDFYTNPFYIHDQCGTYFLANPKYQTCEVWVIRVPALRLGKNEDIEGFKERCYNDMVAKPEWYFNEYDGANKTFGSTFYRNEFELDEIKKRIKHMGERIVRAVKEDYWYQDRQQCMLPGKCDYMSVCDTGGVSEDLYEWRKK